MCQKQNTTTRSKNKHIDWEKRLIIEHLFNVQEKNFTQIGIEINKHRTAVKREVEKGLVDNLNSDLTVKKVYSAKIAQDKHDMLCTAKGPALKIGKDHELAEFIEKKIKEKYSPEVIAKRFIKTDKFKVKIHWKTIYNYIEKNILFIESSDLTYGKYQKSKKNKKKENPIRRMKKEGRRIYDRPECAEKRIEYGHWEMDTVEGRKKEKAPILLVLSERASRQEIIMLMKSKTSNEVVKALNSLERVTGVKNFRSKFKTITTDNGSEFLDYEGIERSYTNGKIRRTSQYFADAYSSWQRGTNENINKMIRRFLPKGSSFKDLTEKEVKRIEYWINNYPRKIFNFKSSNEMYQEKYAS